jgi:hypothetical protein
MVMVNKLNATDPLAEFFAAAQNDMPEPSAALLARILGDAEAEIAQRAAPARTVPRARAAVWLEILALLGGWRALGGLATATLAGVWIGFSGADGVSGSALDFLTGARADTGATVYLLPSDEDFALALGLGWME